MVEATLSPPCWSSTFAEERTEAADPEKPDAAVPTFSACPPSRAVDRANSAKAIPPDGGGSRHRNPGSALNEARPIVRAASLTEHGTRLRLAGAGRLVRHRDAALFRCDRSRHKCRSLERGLSHNATGVASMKVHRWDGGHESGVGGRR